MKQIYAQAHTMKFMLFRAPEKQQQTLDVQQIKIHSFFTHSLIRASPLQ